MGSDIRAEDAVSVPLRGLKNHPQNARQGNLDLITESLTRWGQYSPIVITDDNTILAGHHVVKAARRLKWTHIDAVRVSTGSAQAVGILLADNRTADLATYDNALLKQVLEGLDTLEGTGFGQADIDALDALINDPFTPPDEPLEGTGGSEMGEGGSQFAEIKIGRLWRWEIPTSEYDAWRDNVLGDATRPRAIQTLKRLLDLPPPPPPEPSAARVTATETAHAHPSTLLLHPDNPREGDIGAIIDTLTAHGQYRPIVANIQTGHVVKGNHTLQAIRALGWDTCAVRWINVPAADETKIMLIDNRTSDLATYATDTLKDTLRTLHNAAGTGYSGDDIDDILNGTSPRPGPPPTGQTLFKIGQYGWRTPTDQFDQWADGLDGTTVWHRLRLPEEGT